MVPTVATSGSLPDRTALPGDPPQPPRSFAIRIWNARWTWFAGPIIHTGYLSAFGMPGEPGLPDLRQLEFRRQVFLPA